VKLLSVSKWYHIYGAAAESLRVNIVSLMSIHLHRGYVAKYTSAWSFWCIINQTYCLTRTHHKTQALKVGKRALLLFLMAFIPLLFLVFGARRRRTVPRTALKCYIVAIRSQIARKMLQVGLQRLKLDTMLGGKNLQQPFSFL
jgi:hypothetical protein